MDRSRQVSLQAPMLVPFGALVAGILLFRLGAGVLCGAALMVAGIVVYEIIIRLITDPVSSYRLNNLHFLWVTLLFIGTGIIVACYNSPAPLPEDVIGRAEYASAHVSDLSFRTDGDIAVLNLNAVIDSAGNAHGVRPVKARLSCDDFPFDIDDDIILPFNFIEIADSPASFGTGFAGYMKRKGILYSGHASGGDIVLQGTTSTLHGSTVRLRQNIEELIEKTSLAKPTQEFIITLLLGDKEFLREDVRRTFADAGVSHILALSGMHVSIIAGILLWLLFPLNFTGRYRWRYILAIPLIWIYALVTGLNPSTVRAALMTTWVILCLLLERKNSGWNSLLLATFVILIFDPMALFDIGLQLSFVCVAALIFFAGPLNPVDRHEHPRAHAVFAALLVTLSATSASWVLSSYYFGIFPLSFIPANLIALPLLPLYVMFALIFILFSWFGINISSVAWLLDNGYSALENALGIFGSGYLRPMEFYVPSLTVFLWLAGLVMLSVWINARRKWYFLGSALVLCIIAIVVVPLDADDRSNDGFIISGGEYMPKITVRQGRRQSELIPEANSLSEYTVAGKRIIIADSPLRDVHPEPGCDYLVVTRSCTGSLRTIDSILRPATIVIHTSVPNKREAILLHEADSLHLNVHSIRRNAPLKCIPSRRAAQSQ